MIGNEIAIPRMAKLPMPRLIRSPGTSLRLAIAATLAVGIGELVNSGEPPFRIRRIVIGISR